MPSKVMSPEKFYGFAPQAWALTDATFKLFFNALLGLFTLLFSSFSELASGNMEGQVVQSLRLVFSSANSSCLALHMGQT